jgi:hypothetical protein
MTIKEKILKDKDLAFRSGDRKIKDLLGTVVGEADRKTKNPSDGEMISIIKKMIENLILCNDDDSALYLEVNYMPKSLDMDELSVIIQDYCIKNSITEKKQMGLVMKHLKDNYNGSYDGKFASAIISNILK